MESHSSAQSSLFSAPDEEPHFKKLSPSWWTQAGYEKPFNGRVTDTTTRALKTLGERRDTAPMLMDTLFRKMNKKWSHSEP